MKAELIGIKAVNFTNQNTGEVVAGQKYHLAMNDPDVYGRSAESVFFTNEKISKLGINEPQLGQVFEVQYNKYGKIAEMVLTDKK